MPKLRPERPAPIARPRRASQAAGILLPADAAGQLLSSDARRRLRAIEVRPRRGIQHRHADLDIRGRQPSWANSGGGFIADIGFETYQKILNEAIAELREEEFAKTGETPAKRRRRNRPRTSPTRDRHRPRSLYPGRLHQQFRRKSACTANSTTSDDRRLAFSKI